jgi:hypothetical protein
MKCGCCVLKNIIGGGVFVVNWKSLEGTSNCLYLDTEVEIYQVGTDEIKQQNLFV